jgi:putative ABC transport system permease protein
MSFAGVALSVLLVLIVLSLYRGWSRTGSVYLDLPGSVWIAQEGTTDPFHSTSLLPAGRAAAVGRVPGVLAVLPVYSRHIAFTVASGTRVDAYAMAVTAPTGLPVPESARKYLPAPGHIVIDHILADEAHVRPGGRIDVLGRSLVVDRLLTGGNKIVQFAFLNPLDGKILLGETGQVSYFLLVTAPGTDAVAVGATAARAVPGAEAHTSADFAGSFRRLVSTGFLTVVEVLVGIGIVVGGAVVALTIYTATLEKARDYGVLKAIGANDAYLYRVVVWQSLAIGLAGSILGIAASVLAARLIGRAVPEFVTELRVGDAAVVFGGAMVTAALAAAIPVRRIARIDPAMVFRA